MALPSPEQRLLDRKTRDLKSQEDRLKRQQEQLQREKHHIEERSRELDSKQRALSQRERDSQQTRTQAEQKESRLNEALKKFEQEKDNFIKARRVRFWLLSPVLIGAAIFAGYLTYDMRGKNNLYYAQLQTANQNIETLSESARIIEQQKNKVDSALANSQQQLNRTKTESQQRIEKLNRQIAQLRKKIDAQTQSLTKQQNDAKQLQAKIREEQGQRKRVEDKTVKLNEKVISLEKNALSMDQTSARLREELTSLADERAQQDETLKSMEVRLSLVGKQLSEEKMNHQQTREALSQSTALQQKLSNDIDQLRRTSNQDQEIIVSLKSELKERDNDLSITNRQLDGVLSRIEALKSENTTLASEKAQLQAEIQVRDAKLKSMKNENLQPLLNDPTSTPTSINSTP